MQQHKFIRDAQRKENFNQSYNQSRSATDIGPFIAYPSLKTEQTCRKGASKTKISRQNFQEVETFVNSSMKMKKKMKQHL